MDGKVTLVEYDYMMEEYVRSTTGCPEPSDEEFAAQFKLDSRIVNREAELNKKLPDAVPKSWLTDHGGREYCLVATPNKVDPSDRTKQRMDISLFDKDDVPEAGEPANYAAIELSAECKPAEEADDPFDDNARNYQATSDRRRANFGQIISYAALVFAKQQRTHYLTVLFLGAMARIVRWDRGGAIVTKKFNYTEEPGKLARFFWHFVHLSKAQRGHDTSVAHVLSLSDDYRLMRARADNPRLKGDGDVKHAIGEHARHLFKESLKSNVPWYRIRVGGKQDGRDFLVGAPHFISPGLVGRGTRGYVAIDCSDPQGPFVYLKDAWRVAHESIEQEGSILAYLNDEKTGKVERVPTLVCHGDVDEQKTVSQDAWKMHHPDATDCPVKFHRHYRLVVKEVGLPMSQFESAEQLVYLLARCISAHGQAYKKGVIHRDISAGNVLIIVTERVVDGQLSQERDGILTDWELSTRVDAPEQPRQPDRTGTWQFMSAYTLNFPTVVIRVPDEIEAFFNVLLFSALRFLRHNCPDVSSFMHKYFEGFNKVEGEYCCGETKWNAINRGQIEFKGSKGIIFYIPSDPSDDSSEPPQTHPITFLIQDLLDKFSARYQLDPESAKAFVKAAPVTPPTPATKSSAYFSFFDSKGSNASKRRARKTGLTVIQEQELKEAAETLEDHDAVVDVFGSFITDPALDWPVKDTVPDQLRKDFRPGKDESVTPALSGTGSKRGLSHDGDPDSAPASKRRLTRSGRR
ncbi:hypothetical protein C8Q80DRAFT_1150239 [Daedaleopsis nitida]|nr:hypothetical protein C8Q80DRAFT_1150239 [Daedaleopsis nitida]